VSEQYNQSDFASLQDDKDTGTSKQNEAKDTPESKKKTGCFAHRHMTPAEFGVYKYIEATSYSSGVFYSDSRSLENEFEGRQWRTFQRLTDSLYQKGWLKLLQAPIRNERTGQYSPAQYSLVSHGTWAKTHPNRCKRKKPLSPTTTENSSDPLPSVTTDNPLPSVSQPLSPVSAPLSFLASAVVTSDTKVSKEKLSKEKREKKNKKEPPSFSSSTPKAAGKEKVEHPWVIDIVREALNTSDAAHFETWDRMAISEVLYKNPDFEREEALTATRLFIGRLRDDDSGGFKLTKAGKGLAGRFDAEILNAREYLAKQKYAMEQVAQQIAARKIEEETKRQEPIEVCSVGPSGEGLF
jgi:hypothetical protein